MAALGSEVDSQANQVPAGAVGAPGRHEAGGRGGSGRMGVPAAKEWVSSVGTPGRWVKQEGQGRLCRCSLEGLSVSPTLSSPHQLLALCARPWVPLEMPSEVGRGHQSAARNPPSVPTRAQPKANPIRAKSLVSWEVLQRAEKEHLPNLPQETGLPRERALAGLRLPRKDAGEVKGAPCSGGKIHPWGPLALHQGVLGTQKDTEGLRRGFSVGKREEERLQLKIPGFHFGVKCEHPQSIFI